MYLLIITLSIFKDPSGFCCCYPIPLEEHKIYFEQQQFKHLHFETYVSFLLLTGIFSQKVVTMSRRSLKSVFRDV